MQLALYRAERPEVFEDIIGQKQIVKILQNQIKSGTVSQAYLFAGTHGTGKTSTARILAKALNCMEAESTSEHLPCGKCENCNAIKEGKFVDVIELDAASNNGVDDLRAIIDLVKYPPTIGKYKVFIIDEVHMLSTGAENAFLKTLEEPPEYAIFILATTDPHKVRATIRSRCMQLNFKRVSEQELVEGMARICKNKGVNITTDALGTIASKADGSVRDALSILEQCMAAGDTNIDKALVLEYTGSEGEDFFLGLTDAVSQANLGEALMLINDAVSDGKDSKQLMKDWLEHYRKLMITKYVDKAAKIISASEENLARIKEQADKIDIENIERGIRLISEYINIGRYSDRPRILLETAAVRLAGSDIVPSVQPRQAAAKPVPKAKQEPEPIKAPIQDAAVEEADMELAIATAPSGDAQDMWSRIVAELGRRQRSFGVMITPNSMARSFNGDELVVVIKKNKLTIAQNSIADIERIAKAMYGSNVYVSLVGGDIDTRPIEQVDRVSEEAVLDDWESEKEEDMADEIASDISSALGINVNIIDN